MPESFAEPLQQISINTVIESISDGILLVDRELLITSFNRAAENVTGILRCEAIGRRCSKVVQSSLCGKNCIMQKTFATKTPVLRRKAFVVRAQGDHLPVIISTAVLRNRFNEMIGGVEIFQVLQSPSRASEPTPAQANSAEMITRSQAMERMSKAWPLPISMEFAVQAMEAQAIIAALERNRYNRAAAAHDLGIHKSTFFRKIKQLGIVLPQIDGRRGRER